MADEYRSTTPRCATARRPRTWRSRSTTSCASRSELDDFGISYVEGGWPGSNPRDEEFFARVRKLKLKQARVAAFGSTRRANVAAADDLNLRQLLKAETPVVTIVGKTWVLHVRDDLRISKEANLEVIGDSVAYLKQRVDEVIFDAEHFFDGFRSDPEYSLACLRAATQAGADVRRALRHPRRQPAARDRGRRRSRESRGSRSRSESTATTTASSRSRTRSPRSRRARCRCRARSTASASAAATRTSCSVIPNLQLKLGYRMRDRRRSSSSSRRCRATVYELANIEPYKRQPYVGASAFAHKGGLHVAAVQKNARDLRAHRARSSSAIGSACSCPISPAAAASSTRRKQFGLDVDTANPAVKAVLDGVKQLESSGFQYEGAEASFELLMQEALHGKAAALQARRRSA